jgi:hypothetical protein
VVNTGGSKMAENKIHFDLVLVVHNGPDRGMIIDRTDKIDEYDLEKSFARTAIVGDIQRMLTYAGSEIWKR